jgi:hypothetical protein
MPRDLQISSNVLIVIFLASQQNYGRVYVKPEPEAATSNDAPRTQDTDASSDASNILNKKPLRHTEPTPGK